MRTVIIVAQNFQDEEFVYPYYRLMEEHYPVAVATPTGKDILGKYGVPARATITTADINVDNFDAVLLPGGFESPDRLRMRPEVTNFVKGMNKAGKLVAAICHGPWICISAGMMRGRTATAYISIKDDMINAGANYVEQDVVIDGNLITAPHYRNNGDFMTAVIEYAKREFPL